MTFKTEWFASDSLTIEHNIHISTWYKDIDVSSYCKLPELRDYLVEDDDLFNYYLFPKGIPYLEDSSYLRRSYCTIDKRLQKNYERTKKWINHSDKYSSKIQQLTLPFDNTRIIDKSTVNTLSKHFYFDSIKKADNPIGITAIESMKFYSFPNALFKYMENHNVEFPGGLVHSTFIHKHGKNTRFYEGEELSLIPPTSTFLEFEDKTLNTRKFLDNFEYKDLYIGFFYGRDSILHYSNHRKINHDYYYESIHEVCPDKLSMISNLSFDFSQETIHDIWIYNPCFILFYPHDISQECIEIELENLPTGFHNIMNIDLEISFDDYVSIISSSIPPISIESKDYFIYSHSLQYSLHHQIEDSLFVYVGYPKLQGIQNARVTLLSVLISILFTLLIATIAKIIQIKRNGKRLEKIVTNEGFVCYGSASDCLNCTCYNECRSIKYRPKSTNKGIRHNIVKFQNK